MYGNRLPNHSKMFIPFIMAGDPTPQFTIDLALLLQEAGASVIELGVPYSDPLADGPIIQRSSQRALRGNMNLENAINLAGQMRKKGVKIPIILFTYFNPVLQLGYERFFALTDKNEVDGLLVPDLPFEESEIVRQRCQQNGLKYISLVAPTSNERIKLIANNAEGFLYCVSSLGVTGIRKELSPKVQQFLQDAMKESNIPVAVGFGISSAEQIKELLPHCNGIVIGSAIIELVEKQLSNISTNNDVALHFIQKQVQSMIAPIILER
ncbi:MULTISPECIES: tryptophan synthase subunit alpha [Sutcliffiella]|uniref:Tryptophan synthase alpha chain n=1 Tax=Sutcliffiella cohnii TaxID=33932 RepID=A0A223KRX4_9BACI|nr:MULTISPECIES: tryptophan synthase subunit alpha [Sutcliffiella]AST92242.1 tryptophan synthase subunit alpha [Sutcliffiella cohnii]MED4017301.1 tryptophan synthase subunit alpha [Sutcliffiella cohnii]WBL13474.1 tryptophan synthase subunit alpha [Sutcliffiella sp. NC1]